MEVDMLKADRVVPTTCPYCGVGCQLNLHLRDDLIFRVSGRFDNKVNRGNLCVKGRFGYDFMYAQDRLRQPLMRNSRTHTLDPAAWDAAMDEVASRLAGIRQQYGPESIAFLTSAKCTNEENYLVQKLARGVIGSNHVDHCARL
jgi:predicted molibdopterin-dependent oxidoreductase YjgC